MRKFPSWLVYLAAIGLGFFAFVISTGILSRIIGSRLKGLPIMIFMILISLAAAYFASKYSRGFMTRHISGIGHDPGADASIDDAKIAAREQGRRIAMAFFFSGIVLFVVFIFMLLSGIINAYV